MNDIDSQGRGKFKGYHHGKKLADIHTYHRIIHEVVDYSNLAMLLDCSYYIVDKGLLSTFYEMHDTCLIGWCGSQGVSCFPQTNTDSTYFSP